MSQVRVCCSPALIHLYDLSTDVVVVTDVLRATSAIAAALGAGAKAIMPFSDIESCAKMAEHGFITAAERNGQIVQGFNFGNSPLAFLDAKLDGKKIALTTTNGTKAINMSAGAKAIYTGALTHVSKLANHLIQQTDPILIVCAGWKDKPCLEDTLFAGALAHKLSLQGFQIQCDNALMAIELFESFQGNLYAAIQKSSHFNRLAKMGIEKDIKYCMQLDVLEVIPKFDPKKQEIRLV